MLPSLFSGRAKGQLDNRIKAGGLRDMGLEAAEVSQECPKVRLRTHSRTQRTGKATKEGEKKKFY